MCTGLLLHGEESWRVSLIWIIWVYGGLMSCMCLCAYPGFLLGWLRFPDQPYPPSRPGSDAHRPILPPHLRGLLHSLLPGHHPLHADLFCWFPGGVICQLMSNLQERKFSDLKGCCAWQVSSRFYLSSSSPRVSAGTVLRAHGSLWCFWLVPDSCLCGLPAQQTQRPAIWGTFQERHLPGWLHPAFCGYRPHADW